MGLNERIIKRCSLGKDFDEDHPILYSLGAPVAEDVDRIVTSVDMKVGAYTIAAQPDIARNITVTRTVVDAADTPGTIIVTGTNIAGDIISEVITPGAHGITVYGTKAFKTVASVVGAGWAKGGTTADTIEVGVGKALGVPVTMSAQADCVLGVLGTAITAVTVAVGTPATLEASTVDMSTGTYNGSKRALVWITG